ncbi:MAG: hypothetical protein HRT88_10660 [Lentisphaeraceae bacterium]|nr:hypothetical protein [Lentisphaeraceae bacterium]
MRYKKIMSRLIDELAIDRLPERVNGEFYSVALQVNAEDEVQLQLISADGSVKIYDYEDYPLVNSAERDALQWIYFNLDDDGYLEEGITLNFITNALKLSSAKYISDEGDTFDLAYSNFFNALLAFVLHDDEDGALTLSMKMTQGEQSVDLFEVDEFVADGVFADGTWYEFSFGAALNTVDAIYDGDLQFPLSELQPMAQSLHGLPGSLAVYHNNELMTLPSQKIEKLAIIKDGIFTPAFKYNEVSPYGDLVCEDGQVRQIDFETSALSAVLEKVSLEVLEDFQYAIAESDKKQLLEVLNELSWQIVEE